MLRLPSKTQKPARRFMQTATFDELTPVQERPDRRRERARQFLQNAFEAIESDLEDGFQGTWNGLYHAQRRGRV